MEEPRGLSCSVCYNAFTSVEDPSVPRNLNCGHTFCTACLQKIAAQSLHVYVKCPACKCETPLLTCGHSKSSITSLPKNFGVLEIIECRERKSNHSYASASNTVGIDKTKNNYICEEHDEAKKVYCYTDQCLICIYCQIYGKHQGHNCELASKLAKSSREELQKISHKLENERNKLCKATREITGMENYILNRQFFLKGRVKKYMMLLHHYLTGQEAQIISKIDEMTASKLRVLETQQKTLSEVITKYQELYLLIQTVQNDGDSGIIEDKPTIEKLVDEMSYLAEACQVRPQAENNLMFEFDKDVLNMLEKSSGKIIESEVDDDQTDGNNDSKQHFLDNLLANLEKEIHLSSRQLSSTTDQSEISIDHVETESEEEEESESTISSSEEDGVEEAGEQEEAAGNGENTNDEDESRAEDEEVASEGELLGAVGGDALPEAQQDESKRKDINEKQSLLRELQHEIERLKLLGPTGELIRVIDDSSSSSFETGTDTDDNEHDTHSLQLDFQIRVNNDLSRSKSRASTAAAVQGVLPTKDPSDRRKNNNSRSFGRKRCSVLNCQHHMHATLQCKNCNRVFCRRCASLSLTCNKSDCGHNFINYRYGHHLNKNIKSRLGKNSVSKLRKTSAHGSKSLVPQWVCKRCTMLNEGHVLVCGACETSKDYDPEETRNVCPMCTLVNEPGKTNCELCDTRLEEME